MSREGDEKRVIVRASATDTDGEAVVLEIRLSELADGQSLHVHPEQEERLQVLQGSLLLLVDGRELTLGPGERITVPAGIAHAYSPPGSGSVHFVVETTPAQGPTIEVA